MPTKTVEFELATGLKRPIFSNACLRGSWDANFRYSDNWTDAVMQEGVGEDGCPSFKASISLGPWTINRPVPHRIEDLVIYARSSGPAALRSGSHRPASP